MLRGGEVTAAQVLCAAEQGEAAATVVGWRLRLSEMVGAEGRRVLF